MKRILFATLLIAFGFTLLSSTDIFAQDAPKPYASRTPKSAPAPTNNVYGVISTQKSLSKFTEMIDDADLKSAFSGGPGQPVTVFAPNNEAISDIPSDVMKRIKAGKTSLQSFVKYHTITNSLVGSSAIRGRKISSASDEGESIQFDGTDRTKSPKVNDGEIVTSDIEATNGVVHIVSTALAPPSLATPPAPPPKPATHVDMKESTTSTPVKTGSSATTAASSITSSSPMQSTTTPATPPAETTTGAVPEVTPESPAQEPTPAPAPSGDDSSKGFSVFGHKFGW